MDLLKSLYEKKGNLLKQLEESVHEAEKEGTDFTKDTSEKFEKIYADIEETEKKIGDLERAEKLMQAKAKEVEQAGQPELTYSEVFEKWVRFGPDKLDPNERAVLNKGYRKDPEARTADHSTTTTEGGYTIPTTLAPFIDETLKHVGGMVTPGLAMHWLTADGQTAYVPHVDDTSVKGYILTEGGDHETSATAITFARTTLNAYIISSGMVRITNQLLQDSAFDFAAWMGQMLLKRYYRGMNYYLTQGSGSSQHNGLKNAATTKGEDSDYRAITRTDINNLIYSVNRAYRSNGSIMMNDDTVKYIRALVQSSTYNESPLWQESMRSGEPATMEGYPVIVNPDLEDIQRWYTPIYFGDFSKYVWREVAPGPVIKRSDQVFFDTDETALVAFGRSDGDLPDTSAIKFIRCSNT